MAQLDDMPDLGDDSAMLQQAAADAAEAGVTDAQASSNAAQQLLQGDILLDVVSLHSRCVVMSLLCTFVCLHA